MGMTSSDKRELLTQSAARQLLERAGEIDSESTSIDTLRSAAREAGISEAAFEAALLEMREKKASPPPLAPSRSLKRAVVAMAVGIASVLAVTMVFIPRVAPVPVPVSQEFTVKCVRMETAADIARGVLGPN